MLRCSCLLLFSLFCCLCWRPSLFCYIRNCPLGGKRSVPSIIADADSSDGGKMIRKCLSVGEKSNPCHCINECDCCMEDGSKCHFNTTLSRFCALENELPVQCQIPPPLSRRCWKIGTDDDAYTAYEMCCSRSRCEKYEYGASKK